MNKSMTDVVWHPFTQMKLAAPPIHIERAKDTVLYAKDGKQYIDAISSWWVNIHGHSNPFIAASIAEQASTLEQVIFAGFTHTPAQDLAQKLIEVLPEPFAKVFFSDNGSTAVEVALKMALQYWYNQGFRNKTTIVAFEDAYHGDTFGAMSVGAKSPFNAAFEGLLFETVHLPTPNSENKAFLKKELQKLIDSDTVAAFIFEPLIQGAGGMLMYDAADLDELLQIVKQKNVICIADEVMTGFGRTGKNFASNYLHETPDIICLSKGITGGFMPLGVTVCSQAIFDAFYSNDRYKTFFHGHSYTANPLACSAANASLAILLSDDCQTRIANICQKHAEFAKKLENYKNIKIVRQQGTIIAIELKNEESSSYFNTIRDTIYNFCLERGVLLRPLGNVVYIMPPYCITDTELDTVYGVITDLIQFLDIQVNSTQLN